MKIGLHEPSKTGGHTQTLFMLATVPVGMKKMVSHGRNHADYFLH